MKQYKDLKDRCFNIKNELLYKVFVKFGIPELHKIIFFLIHNRELYYFDFRLDESWFYKLNPDDQILLLDIHKFYENK